MNALTPTKSFRVVERLPSNLEAAVVLERDIRVKPERIADYCLTTHEPIYEDLATLVESMACFDRLVPRRRSGGWTRKLTIQLPVYEHWKLQSSTAVEALTEAAWFLTGDQWSFEFVARQGAAPTRQGHLDLARAPIRHVIPFSDGLDSFAQARLSVGEHGRDAVMLVRSGLGHDRVLPGLLSLRVPRKFKGARLREVTYRTRPLVFYTLAAIAAVITGAEAVVVGENGQGAIGPACLPFPDEWWFRSTHPGFVARWARFLAIVFEQPVRFEQPQLWNTKGEVLSSLLERGLLAGWNKTSSCSARPFERHGHRGCGACGGCLLRTVSAHTADIASRDGSKTFDVFASDDTGHDGAGKEKQMSRSEREVAVRAIAVMAGFARLAASPGGQAAITREAQWIDPSHPELARAKLDRLLRQHRAEWEGFLGDLPNPSWVREIAGQL